MTLDDPYRVRVQNPRDGFFTRDDKRDVDSVWMAPDIEVENCDAGAALGEIRTTVMMSRYARYLVIQNADSAKNIVRSASIAESLVGRRVEDISHHNGS